MSTSSSSAASGDDVAVVAEVDDVKDVSGFNGWAHEEICFDDEPKASKTALHLAAEESARDWGDWTGTDEKKVTKKKNMKVGVCEGEESYEGIMEPEEEEDEPSYAPTTDVPKPPPSPELEMESLDEEEEEESVTPRPQYEPAPPRPATLPEPQKGDDKRYVPIPPPIVEEGATSKESLIQNSKQRNSNRRRLSLEQEAKKSIRFRKKRCRNWRTEAKKVQKLPHQRQQRKLSLRNRKKSKSRWKQRKTCKTLLKRTSTKRMQLSTL